jgi:hypothetical protein
VDILHLLAEMKIMQSFIFTTSKEEEPVKYKSKKVKMEAGSLLLVK